MAGRSPERRRHHYRNDPFVPKTDREMLAYFLGRRLAAELDPSHTHEMPSPATVEGLLTDDERALRSTMTPTRWLACLLLGWSDESDGR